MVQRVLEINVAYAEDLKDVNLFTKMDVYVVVSVVGDNSNIKQKTNVHRDSGTHPTWNFPMRFTIDDPSALQGRLSLIFRLKCEGSFIDTDLGEVCVPIKDLLDSSSPTSKSGKFVHYQVTKPSGGGQGMLTFSYKFGEITNGPRAVEPVKCGMEERQAMANPPPPPPQHQQPMGPFLSYCGLSGQETYQPNLYPQPPEPYPYAYPAPPEQAGYIYSPSLPPPPPVQETGSLYIYPPPPFPGPNYTYQPHQQQQQLEQVYSQYPPAAPGGCTYPPQQQSPNPYPPQPEHQYAYPPQVYPGHGYQPQP